MIGKLSGLFHELGMLNAAFYLVHRALLATGHASLFRYRLVAQPVAEKPLLPPRRGRSIDVVCAPPENADGTLPLDARQVEARIAAGDICLTARTEGCVCGYLWLRFGAYDETEVRCRFVPEPEQETSWDYDLYIPPAQRMGFVFARLWDEANALLRKRCVRWTMSRISSYNTASSVSHRRLGAVPLATATFLRVGPCQLTVATTAPYLHFSTCPGSTPRIRLRAID